MTPEEILALANADLDAAIQDYRSRLDAALAVEDPTPEQAEEAVALDETLASLEAEKDRRDTSATRLNEVRERRAAAQAQAEQEAAARAEAEAEAEAEAAAEAEAEAQVEAEQEQEQPEAVAASGPRRSGPPAGLSNRRQSPPPAETDESERPVVTITAAAEVPDRPVGSLIPDMLQVAEAVMGRAKGFPQFTGGRAGGDLQRFPVASFAKPFPEDLIADSRVRDTTDLFNRAVDEHRLPGGSLTAAGGWCIPSERILDLCGGATTDGLFDLPEIQVRGGISYTRGPDFSALYAGGFTQTEAQAIAGTTKPCVTITCPTFEEVRLDAIGMCVKVPILTNSAWPELVQSFMQEALVAHQHRVSAYLLNAAVSEAGAALDLSTTFNTGSATTGALAAIEYVVERKRQQYRLGQAATMEVVLPMWTKALYRADLSQRMGVDLLNVTDQMINTWFAARRARVQFVYNWQELVLTDNGYPSTYQALVYPAGTFIRGSASVISLDAVYDAASLSVNEYTGMFFEEGILLATRCYTPSLVTLNACAAGKSAAADMNVCLTENVV